MKHNVFDKDDRQKENVLVHSDGSEVSSEEISTIFGDIKRYGSLKDSVLAHGIDNVDYLFPDAQTLANTPRIYSARYRMGKEGYERCAPHPVFPH